MLPSPPVVHGCVHARVQQSMRLIDWEAHSANKLPDNTVAVLSCRPRLAGGVCLSTGLQSNTDDARELEMDKVGE